jgi:hypothetical protein
VLYGKPRDQLESSVTSRGHVYSCRGIAVSEAMGLVFYRFPIVLDDNLVSHIVAPAKPTMCSFLSFSIYILMTKA